MISLSFGNFWLGGFIFILVVWRNVGTLGSNSREARKFGNPHTKPLIREQQFTIWMADALMW